MTIPTQSRFSVYPGRPLSPDESRISASPFHVIARVLLIATICGAPWAFGAVQPWAWGTLLVLASLTLVLWAVGCTHRGVLRISLSPLYWPFLAFLILAVLQLLTGWSADHEATREAVLKIVTNLAFFFLVGQLLNARPENGRALEWLGLIVTLLAFALSVLGLAQIFYGSPRSIYWTYTPAIVTAIFGPYVNHNNYAGLMEMLIPISVAYVLSRPGNSILRFLLWCAVALVIISVWISGSRGAAIVLLMEGVLLGVILIGHWPRGAPLRLLALLLGIVLFSSVVFSWLVSSGRVGGRAWSVFETNQSLAGNLGDRWRVGIDTLHMARSHPWTGVGVGCFEYVFPNYMTFPMDLHWTHAHDDILEATAETGLPGVVMMVVAFVLFIRVGFRHIKERLQYGWGWIQMGAVVGAVGLFFHSFVDFNLRVPANAAWFVVCLAIATHPGPAQRDRRMIAAGSKPGRSREFLT